MMKTFAGSDAILNLQTPLSNLTTFVRLELYLSGLTGLASPNVRSRI
jgi:hypothetical protein